MKEQSVNPARKTHGAAVASNASKQSRKVAKHPIAALSGTFKDDPLWDEFIDAMQRARAEEDAKEDVPG